ncbi:murein biosynthesis integral membrane protein MurJ [Rheinheimera sp. MMS21-TC3]|uniref:murein biosynthesis integral membrane protein MurJ n=1 Tax=Rheinheimera sp. MMS21-TC3 TaxID=3072790 RepID=UPI0028C4EEE2|nr:murein biosynthesis integral membrane protein MurJ [Rheinheimera sp. MMS21-TC3]WNO59985.1 murein biosynthesis integral membrane protein MurJ [Rheinheimera sp. MMS21-TC3]
MSDKLLKSGLIVSAMTLISRVLGLIRDVVVANFIGAGAAADVFFFANRIPNFLRRLFAEGAFSQAFVPVLAEVKTKHGDDAVRLLIAKVTGSLGVVVTVVTLIGVVASPVIAMLFGMGWFVEWLNGGPEQHKFELASLMLKITFPYLWFVSLVALSGAILNTYNRFAVAAFTPVFLNIAIIACAIFLAPRLEVPAMALAWGVFIGGAIQLLFQLPFLAKAGFLVWPKWGWHDANVVKIRKLMLPALFGVSVSQINLLLDTVIASFLLTGAVSWLYYSDRLIEFPLGLFGIAIATVILPNLSRHHAGENAQRFSQTLDWSLRFVALFGIPAMAGLIVLGKPIISLLFMRGEFSQNDVLMVSHSLVAYSLGLFSFMLIKVLAPGFYARQDIKTPVRIGIIAMVANMGFNLMLAPFLSYVGLALATSMSASLNAFLLYRGLKLAGVYQITKATWLYLAKLVLAAVIMAALLYWQMPSFSNWLLFSFSQQAMHLIGLCMAAIFIYFLLLLVLGIRLSQFKVNSIAESK